jgi:hypothetical protein
MRMSLRYAPQGSVNGPLRCSPSSVRVNFVYVAVKYRVWCRPKIYEENMLIKLYKNTAYNINLLKTICCHYNKQKQQIIEKRGKRK